MIKFLKLRKKFTTLPLFFQVFAIACGLMLVLATYGFLTEAFREARVFLYSSLTGILIFALINLATSNRNLKESGVVQLISLLLLFITLPLFLVTELDYFAKEQFFGYICRYGWCFYNNGFTGFRKRPSLETYSSLASINCVVWWWFNLDRRFCNPFACKQ